MIWDLPNLLVCLMIVFAAYLLGKIKASHALCLALLSFAPFCLNGVLFDPRYMPDQFTYWRMLSAIRDFNYNSNFYNSRVTEAAYMYALFPLPFVETVNSLGFFNKFLMISVFIWASAVLRLRGWVLWFLLFYPSLILYSSLGLRDMLICTMMLMALWTLMRGWYLVTLICLILLVQIKMQNALLVVLFSAVYLFDKYSNLHYTKKQLFALFAAFATLLYLAFPFMVNKIEYYRLSMYLEDGGQLADYHAIVSLGDCLWQIVLGLFRALFYPLPWMAKTKLQLLQSLENIAVVGVLAVFTWRSYQELPKQTLMWFCFFLSGMCMYGLIVSNVGTIVRYKLPFIVVYLIFLSYERVRYNPKQLRPQSYALAS
ncbi:MAG: hypothetical protein LEGION0403_FIIPPAGN_00671 [Legionella sp.]|uniref:hypothetical protein n=1 Tax=Legionella sp. TaxID=459 RepID=UPI003D0A74D3